MKKLVVMGTTAVLLMACSPGTPFVQPASTPGSAETEHVPSEPAQRYSFFCRSLDSSPDVQLSSLEEVWAASNYLRMKSCEVSYVGPEPFQPTAEESAAIEIANPGGVHPSDGLGAYLAAVALCTRVSEETAPGGFAGSRKEILRAAARICPEGPQGKIIKAWADGSRVGDGRHVVGDAVAPGNYVLVMPSGTAEEQECAWTVAGSDGQVRDRKSSSSAPEEVNLEIGEVFTSDKCGIWGKMTESA